MSVNALAIMRESRINRKRPPSTVLTSCEEWDTRFMSLPLFARRVYHPDKLVISAGTLKRRFQPSPPYRQTVLDPVGA